jgi:hypothetical protein
MCHTACLAQIELGFANKTAREMPFSTCGFYRSTSHFERIGGLLFGIRLGVARTLER